MWSRDCFMWKKLFAKLQDAFKTTSEERSVTESPSIGAPGIPFLAMKKKRQ